MKSKTLQTGMLAGVIAMSGVTSTWAELPSLEEKPWYGYYAGYAGKRANIGLDTDGGAVIIPLKKDREPMTSNFFIPLIYQVVEVAPNGKEVVKKIDVDSLTSTTAATAKPDKIVFTGKVEGDATFEGYFEVVRGVVMVGGRILEKGTLTNPLKLNVFIKFPQAYQNAQDKNTKEFKKKIEDDKLEVKLMDGKKFKLSPEDDFDPAAPQLVAGVSQAQVEVSEFGGNVFTFTAAPNSKITVGGSKGAFYTGLTIRWAGVNDTDGRARMAIDVK